MSQLANLAGLAAALLLAASGCSIMRGPDAPNAYIDDSGLSARVKDALVKDTSVKATEINVQTSQGVVNLSGVVDSAAMARRAEQVTRGTSGVKGVESDLQVANPSTEAAQR
jgi:osmotically-inducible protein OsmY